MRTDLFRLRASQLQMLLFLDDCAEEDSVGRSVEELTGCQRIVAEEIEGTGLIRFDVGWQDRGWYRLTALGRELVRMLVRREGGAGSQSPRRGHCS